MWSIFDLNKLIKRRRAQGSRRKEKISNLKFEISNFQNPRVLRLKVCPYLPCALSHAP
jgi:hypothetical protein